MTEQPDRSPKVPSLYERITSERRRDLAALAKQDTALFDRLIMNERSLTLLELKTEKRLGSLWQWQTAAIVLSLVNLMLWLFWRR